ncbi:MULTISPECIES: ABC transporter permease [unclassified Acinetobacter]|uniref:ABC transporter permease n=1 Tax=unclassified Acinetobacter TaxID=196816 RepID=UPI002934A263|nr:MULTISPECIES: ABC transporter permease [unclassified Acinetobacter]WOE31555.1 ABC transporter permease [Acinetobacter sp. SAAs470]WOE39752.1 ABC transporter permease [Acinetobacter sp. SAAs474]
MLHGIQRELKYLLTHKWDLCLVTLFPLFLILIFGSMFLQGVPKHLPMAIIDQDNSDLSRNIEYYVSLNEKLKIYTISSSPTEVEQLLNQNKIWGYIHIPDGAEQRLVKAQDAEINMAFNQSYYSVGTAISSAMLSSTLQATANYLKTDYFDNNIPYIDIPTPNVKMSVLFNPNMNYEFYLEPFLIPAILHLLLSCCVAFSVGIELKNHTVRQWVNQQSLFSAILSKNLVYIVIFLFWTALWMIWLVGIRGWFIAGEGWFILLGQLFFYAAYSFMATLMVLIFKDSLTTFGILAVYGGSSLSFAGVTLPLTNAPQFTKFWSDFIPYTHYAKLQTEQWAIGSPLSISLIPLSVLILYSLIFFVLSIFFLKRYLKGSQV